MEAANGVSGIRAEDPELVSIVANLVEWPSAVCGAFEQEFLRLPEAVLITPMREHQRYFAVRDRAGRLMPNFFIWSLKVLGFKPAIDAAP